MTDGEAQFLKSALSVAQSRVIYLEQQLKASNVREASAIFSLQKLQIEMAELNKKIKES